MPLNTDFIKTNIVDIVDDDTVTAPPINIFTGDQSVISSMNSTSSVASTSSVTCSRFSETLNLTPRLAGKIITDLLQYATKEEGVNKNLKKIYPEGKKIRGEIFEGKKRVTAGLLFKASQKRLDSNVLNLQERKERIVFDIRELARLKALEEYTMRKTVAIEILALNKPITALSAK